jgi:hypothetical protein
MVNSQSAIWEGIFDMGRRTYFVKFRFNGDYVLMKDGTFGRNLVYGATVYRRPKNGVGSGIRVFSTPGLCLDNMVGSKLVVKLIKGNMHTARERYGRMPVSTEKYNKQVMIPSSVKTRYQMEKYFKTKKFLKSLVNIFAQLGVRWRSTQHPNLMEKEYVHKRCIIQKAKRRFIGEYQMDLSVFQKRRSQIKLSKISGGEIGYEWTEEMKFGGAYVGSSSANLPVHKLSFIEQSRIFHVVYQRCNSGHTRYAACIYSPPAQLNLPTLNEDGTMDEEDWEELEDMGYDAEQHFDTAFSRFEHPIEIYLPNKMPCTRLVSAKLGRIDDQDIIHRLRKKIAKYGVRAKQGGNHHRFITLHQIKQDFAQVSKLLNKNITNAEKDFKDWKTRSLAYMSRSGREHDMTPNSMYSDDTAGYI